MCDKCHFIQGIPLTDIYLRLGKCVRGLMSAVSIVSAVMIMLLLGCWCCDRRTGVVVSVLPTLTTLLIHNSLQTSIIEKT